MHSTIHTGASCEAPDFFPHGREDAPPICEQDIPNPSGMGIVTLAGDGEFISSRRLTQDELKVEWAKHRALHGL